MHRSKVIPKGERRLKKIVKRGCMSLRHDHQMMGFSCFVHRNVFVLRDTQRLTAMLSMTNRNDADGQINITNLSEEEHAILTTRLRVIQHHGGSFSVYPVFKGKKGNNYAIELEEGNPVLETEGSESIRESFVRLIAEINFALSMPIIDRSECVAGY